MGGNKKSKILFIVLLIFVISAVSVWCLYGKELVLEEKTESIAALMPEVEAENLAADEFPKDSGSCPELDMGHSENSTLFWGNPSDSRLDTAAFDNLSSSSAILCSIEEISIPLSISGG